LRFKEFPSIEETKARTFKQIARGKTNDRKSITRFRYRNCN
jgi:hypothetical protein